MSWVNNALRVVDVRDLVGLLGFAALCYGLAQWWPPAAWIAAGALLLTAWSVPLWRRKV